MSSEKFRLFIYPSSSAALVLCTQQRLKSRGLTLIRVLISLARGEGRGAKIWLWWKLATAGLHLLLDQGLLSHASHIPIQLLVYSTCSLLIIIITEIMHGMQGQNSRLPTPSFWCSLRHVYNVKSECEQREQARNILYLSQENSSWFDGTGSVNSSCTLRLSIRDSLVWRSELRKSSWYDG